MNSIKLFISSFLLFVYSFSFVHYIIPHCDNESTVVHVHSELEPINHKHHDSEIHEADTDQHKHIQHEGHFDEGIYDFLFCFLSNIEHQENICVLTNYIASKTDSNVSRPFNSKVQLLAVYSVLCFPELLSKSEVNQDEKIAFYVAPLLHLSPNRGPPIFS